MKNRNLLLGLLGLSLTMVGCDPRIDDAKITDKKDAPVISLDESAAESVVEQAGDATKNKLQEVVKSNTISGLLNLSANASASIKVDLNGQALGLEQNIVGTATASASLTGKGQANVDVEGLKKMDLEKGNHADMSKTEVYAEVNAEAHVNVPKELSGMFGINDGTADAKIDKKFEGKAGIKDSKTVDYEKTDDEEAEWYTDNLNEDKGWGTTGADDFAEGFLEFLAGIEGGEDAEEVEEIAAFTEALAKVEDYFDGTLSVDDLLTYIETNLTGGAIAESQMTNIVKEALTQVKAADFSKIIGYTTNKSTTDLGYDITVEFKYDEFKTAWGKLSTAVAASETLAPFADYVALVDGLLPENVVFKTTASFTKDGMIEGVAIDFELKGAIDATDCAEIAKTGVVPTDIAPLLAAVNSIEYDVKLNVAINATIGTEKVTVQTLTAPATK